MLLFTTDDLPHVSGYKCKAVIGAVFGEGKGNSPVSARKAAIQELWEECNRAGGHAVIALRLDATAVVKHLPDGVEGEFTVFAYGTAIAVE